MPNKVSDRLYDLVAEPGDKTRDTFVRTVKEWKRKYPRSYRQAVPMLRQMIDAIVEGAEDVSGRVGAEPGGTA